MSRTALLKFRIRFCLGVMLTLQAVGCSVDVDGGTGESVDLASEPSPDGEAVETSAEALSVEIAAVQLRSGHTISFVDYPELDLARVTETLGPDIDGNDADPAEALLQEDMQGLSLLETYRRVTGEAFDPEVALRLEGVDRRIGAGRLSEVALATAPSSESSPTLPSATVTAPAGGIGQVQQAVTAACQEPAFDFIADGEFLGDFFCTFNIGARYCEFNRTSHLFETSGKTHNFATTQINQSFCSNATFRTAYRKPTSCIIACFATISTTLDSGTLAPRTQRTTSWTSSSKYDWQSFVKSSLNNFTGLWAVAY